MDKAIVVRAERLLLPGVVPIKKFLRRQLEEKLRLLEERGCSPEERKRLLVKIRGYRNRIDYLAKKRGRGEPPVLGEFILLLAVEKKDRACVLGDLAEEYPKWEARKGRARADLWFYWQALRSAWPWARKALWWVILVWLSRQI